MTAFIPKFIYSTSLQIEDIKNPNGGEFPKINLKDDSNCISAKQPILSVFDLKPGFLLGIIYRPLQMTPNA